MDKYFKQYQWSDLFDFLRNEKLDPAVCTEDFPDRLVVISGATSGIGLETAKKYASHGADILSINRSQEKSVKLCRMLEEQYGVKCSFLIADFEHLTEVRAVARKLAALEREIAVLIHNAGSFLTHRRLTGDNQEVMFQTIYLSSFIINYHLKEKFLRQSQGRIIFVNSEGHRFAISGLRLKDLDWRQRRFSGSKGYGSAKLAQLLSMLCFRDLFSGSGVTINAMHPGNVRTNMGQNNGPFYKWMKKTFIDRSAKSPEISAEALYFLGVDSSLEGISGKFFNLTTQEVPAPPALDREAAEALWNVSLDLGGIEE
ncbi:MAG: SDR family NAD(P)-dependent oxidoreductase [Anaerolineales bacterium]